MAERRVVITATLRDQAKAGLESLGKGFKRFTSDIEDLNSRLGQVTGKLGGFAALIGGGALARQSLEAAEKEYDARVKVLAALRGNVEAAREVFELTDAIQAKTRVGNEALNEAAALLLGQGRTIRGIGEDLTAVVNTAEATGASIEQIAQAILLFDQGSAGLLTGRVPGLRRLQEDGRLAADGVRYLNEQFGGVAEALARTPFGEATQQMNLLGDETERLGNQLVGFKVESLRGLVSDLRSLIDLGTSPEARGVTRLAEGLVRPVQIIGEVLAGIVVLLGSGRFLKWLSPTAAVAGRVAVFLGIVLIRLTAVGVIVSAVAVVVERILTSILRWTGVLSSSKSVWGSIRNSVADLGGGLREVIGLIGEAKVGADSLLDLLYTRLAQVFAVIASLGPLAAAAFGVGRSPIDREFERMLSRIGELEQDRERRLTEARERSAENRASILSDEVDRSATAHDRMVSDAEQSSRRVSDIMSSLWAGLSDLTIEQAEEQARLFPAGEAGAAGVSLIVGDIRRQVEEGKVALADFFAFRRRVMLDALGEEIDKESAVTGELGERLGVAKGVRDEAVRELESVRASLDMYESLGASEEVRESILERIRQTYADIAELDKEIAKTAEEQVQHAERHRELTVQEEKLRRDLAASELAEVEELFRVAEDARSELDRVRADVARRAEAGLIFPAEARAAEEEALAEYRAALDGTLVKLEELRSAYPELGKAIDGFVAKLRGMREEVGPVEQSFGRLVGGVRDGVGQTIRQFDDLRRAGVAIGQEIATALSDLFGNFFSESRKQFREWLGEFLRGLANLLAQIALFRQLATWFPALFGGGGLPPLSTVGGGAAGGLAERLPVVGLEFGPGGRVPGPAGVRRDVVRARLMPGEFVQTVDAVRYYGLDVMEALRRRIIPRELFALIRGSPSVPVRAAFQSGGAALDSARGFGGAVPVGFVADEDNMERLVRAAERSLLSWVGRNSEEIGSLIDRKADRRR